MPGAERGASGTPRDFMTGRGAFTGRILWERRKSRTARFPGNREAPQVVTLRVAVDLARGTLQSRLWKREARRLAALRRLLLPRSDGGPEPLRYSHLRRREFPRSTRHSRLKSLPRHLRCNSASASADDPGQTHRTPLRSSHRGCEGAPRSVSDQPWTCASFALITPDTAPMSARPATFAFTPAITLPMSFGPAAPTSAIVASMRCATSASESFSGM